MAVDINVKPEESKSSSLKRVEFNNLALCLSKYVPSAKSRAISKLNRALKLLQRKEAKHGSLRGKTQSRAERLVEQIELLKKLGKLDIAKLLFLVRRSAKEGHNDANSDIYNKLKISIQEEALSYVADSEHISATLQSHRERYPNLVEDAFKHLKVMGLKYRRDRISKLKSSSKAQKLLAREHLFLVTAHQLMGCERGLALLSTTEDDLMQPSISDVDQNSEKYLGFDGEEASSYPREIQGNITQFSETNSISTATREDPTSNAPWKKSKRSLEGTTMEGKAKKRRYPVEVEEPASKQLSMHVEARPGMAAYPPRITCKQIGSAQVMRLFNLEALKETNLHSSKN